MAVPKLYGAGAWGTLVVDRNYGRSFDDRLGQRDDERDHRDADRFVKASLVALFFMHLRWEKPMNAIIFCSTLFFLGLFLIGCYTDTVSRPHLEPTNLKVTAPPQQIGPQGGQLAPTVGHGTPGAMSPSGGGPVITGRFA